MTRLEIENATREEINRDIRSLLREMIPVLQSSIVSVSSVITPAQAAIFAFDGSIKPARVCEYIRGKNLPAGILHPLPARMVGSTYHIPVDRLNRWRSGETTVDDLYPWQRQKLDLFSCLEP